MRKIARSIHEDARNVARSIAKTPQYQQSHCERKKVEMLFARLKRILRLDQLRLRGLTGASDEFTLAATVQNLRRLAKLASPSQLLGGIDAPTECKIGRNNLNIQLACLICRLKPKNRPSGERERLG